MLPEPPAVTVPAAVVASAATVALALAARWARRRAQHYRRAMLDLVLLSDPGRRWTAAELAARVGGGDVLDLIWELIDASYLDAGTDGPVSVYWLTPLGKHYLTVEHAERTEHRGGGR